MLEIDSCYKVNAKKSNTLIFSKIFLKEFFPLFVNPVNYQYLCAKLKEKDRNMEYLMTPIEGVWVLEPRVFGDSRGYFMETWQQADFERHIGLVSFVQDNESKSSYGVLRGLHYQRGEYSQAKLVRVIKGRVLDVAVDLRKSSPTFGQHIMVELSEENKKQIFIPRGFAHGFLVLSEEAIFTYKVDNVYAPQSECSIRFDDPTLGIQWPIAKEQMLLSPKDTAGVAFRDAVYFD